MIAAVAPDPLAHGWWLASRASGVVALALVTVSTLLGLAMALRPARRPASQPRLVTLHEQLAVTGLVAIAVHGLTLLGDPWLKPGLAGIALPGAMAYRPLFTSLGVVAGWLAALLGLSYYARGRIGAQRWRSVHRLTAVAYGLAVVHTLGAGTDAGAPWLRWPVVGSAALALGLLTLRAARRPTLASPTPTGGPFIDGPRNRSPLAPARRAS